MNQDTLLHPTPSSEAAIPAAAPAAARRVLRLLQRLPQGQLTLYLPGGDTQVIGRATEGAERAQLWVHDWRVFERTLKAGDIGLAEAYIDGQWDTPDLAALLRLCIVNREHIEQLVYGRWWGRLLYRLRHLRQRNSRAGSEKNIHAHYDLGNAFYRLWLDPGMSYSAAWFEGREGLAAREVPLIEAQEAKLRRTLREARVAPGQRVLEVGCGWGGLAELAAREFGAEVTGVTLSREQLQWGRDRIRAAGLEDRVDLRYQDYRDLPAAHAAAPFDAIVSIEMFEAVGHEYWRGYFQMLWDCLKPGGHACIQSITIRDDLFPRYLRSTDFIQQYIFPGGLLPSPSAFEAEARRAGFVVENRLAFGRDYAETLRRWHADFLRTLPEARALGFDRRFEKIWTFYLAYCEAAFDTGNTDVMQFTLRKPAP